MGMEGIRSSQPPSFTEVSSTDTSKKSGGIKEALGKGLEAIKRYSITPTGMLPVSSRGVAFNLVRTPIRLAQSAGKGVVEMVKNKSIESFGTKFKSDFTTQMKRDWGGGISDSFKDLSKPANKERGIEIAQNNLRYAGFMYNAKLEGNETIGNSDKSITWSGSQVSSNSEVDPKLQNLMSKVKELGFQEDSKGNFYDLKTGTIFTLVHDKENKELVLSFMGLGNQSQLDIGDNEQNKSNSSCMKSIAKDFFGGVPDCALQAIKLGKLLQEEAKGAGLSPVAIGHSHGGGLAQCAAGANGFKGVSFNSRPMGAGVRRYIGQSKLAKNAENMVTFSGKGDFLTQNRVLNVLAKATERVIGMPVPRSVGKGYELPKADPMMHPNTYQMVENQHVQFYDQLHKLIQ